MRVGGTLPVSRPPTGVSTLDSEVNWCERVVERECSLVLLRIAREDRVVQEYGVQYKDEDIDIEPCQRQHNIQAELGVFTGANLYRPLTRSPLAKMRENPALSGKHANTTDQYFAP